MSGTLRLPGTPTPPRPTRSREKVVACRCPGSVVAWIEDQAATEHVSVNRWVRNLFEDAQREGPPFPSDVMAWLTAQAAANGEPGDWRHAVIVTVRDLVATYPDGVRLPSR